MITKEQYEEAVSKSISVSDVCRYFGMEPIGGTHQYVSRKLKELGVDTSHFHQDHAKNAKGGGLKEREDAVSYSKRKNLKSSILLRKMIEDGIKERKCECCGLTEWIGNPIPLELHHIDGNHNNNNFVNLQALCLNCHSLTENYKGKKNKIAKRCKKCGCELPKDNESGICSKCSHEMRRKVERPSKEELNELIKEKSKEEIGRIYGVTGKAVAKWIKQYEKDEAI